MAALALGWVLAACLAAAPSALAEPVAKEQYILTLPGVPGAGEEQVRGPEPLMRQTGGLSGERRPPQSRLGAVAGAALSPAPLALIGLAALGSALMFRHHPRARFRA